MVALDCEMCETTEGLALTRITVVDRRGQVCRSQFRTSALHFSGMRPRFNCDPLCLEITRSSCTQF